MLARQNVRRKGKDFTDKIITSKRISQPQMYVFNAIRNKIIATNKSNTPNILTSINIKSGTSFKTL